MPVICFSLLLTSCGKDDPVEPEDNEYFDMRFELTMSGDVDKFETSYVITTVSKNDINFKDEKIKLRSRTLETSIFEISHQTPTLELVKPNAKVRALALSFSPTLKNDDDSGSMNITIKGYVDNKLKIEETVVVSSNYDVYVFGLPIGYSSGY